MNYTQIDTEKKVRRLLPTVLRFPQMVKLLVTLLIGFTNLWATFLSYRIALLEQLDINITVGSLQNKLRQLYPEVTGFKVYIITNYIGKQKTFDQYLTEHRAPEYEYFLSESAPVDTYDYFLSEFYEPFDYTVYVPTAYTSDLADIEALLERYRPSGKEYNVIFENII